MKQSLRLSVPALAAVLALGSPAPLAFSQEKTEGPATSSLGAQYEAIVNIECNSIEADYQTPWGNGGVHNLTNEKDAGEDFDGNGVCII